MASAKEKEPVNHELWPKDEDEKETIASRVKELRKGRQWNQAQLAKQVGVARSQITRLESGETQNVNSDLIIKLAHVFGVTTDYLLCVTGIPHERYAVVEKLGLSEGAAKRLANGSIDRDVVNRLLEHKEFGNLCALIRIYFDDSMAEGYLANNEVLTFGTVLLKQFVQEHPDKRGDVLDTIRLLNAQKISTDEINTERISRSFQRILTDIRTGMRKKEPTTPTAAHELIDIMQNQTKEKPLSQITLDDIADAIMIIIDRRHHPPSAARKIIERFVRWVMRYYGGSRRNSVSKKFEAHQNILESLDEAEKKMEEQQALRDDTGSIT